MPTQNVTITVRLDAAIMLRVREIAKAERRPLGKQISYLLENQLRLIEKKEGTAND